MRAMWKRSGAALRAGLVAAMAATAVGIGALVVTLLSTTPGSGPFDAGITISRMLLQAGAAIGLVTLGAILAQRQRRKTDGH